MKNIILIIALLITSIFAGALTLGMQDSFIKSKDTLIKEDSINSKKNYQLIASSPTPSPKVKTSTDCSKFKLGDVNTDFKVDISDVIYINMYLKGEKELNCKENADVNSDNKITQDDRDYLNAYLFEGGPAPIKKSDNSTTEKDSPTPSSTSSPKKAEDVKILEVKDLEDKDVPNIPQKEKEKTLDEVKDFESNKKLGFTESWSGTGSINNGIEGFLISAFWANQKFIDKGNELIEKVSGKLKIANSANYHLSLIEKNSDSITFDVTEDSSSNKFFAKGNLVLTKKAEYTGLTIWVGNLDFTSGPNAGTWKIEISTTNHVVKPSLVPSSIEEPVFTKPICKDIRGDANADGKLDVSDVVYINLYLNGEKPLLCKDNTDVNSDGLISQADIDFLLDYLFKDGKTPKPVDTPKIAIIDTCNSIKKGDANTDGQVDISDGIYINLYLQGEKKLECPDSADVNGDGKVSEEDRDYLLSYLFKGGEKPVESNKLNVNPIPVQKEINFWTKLKKFFFG